MKNTRGVYARSVMLRSMRSTELMYDLDSYKNYFGLDHLADFWDYFTGQEGLCYNEDISPISYEEWLVLQLPFNMRAKWL